MSEISPAELLNQFRGMIQQLSLPWEEQRQWLEQRNLPVDEMYLQLDDAIPAWYARLDAASLIDRDVKQALSDLMRLLIAMKTDKGLWVLSSLAVAPEWNEVRRAARRAVELIDAM